MSYNICYIWYKDIYAEGAINHRSLFVCPHNQSPKHPFVENYSLLSWLIIPPMTPGGHSWLLGF